MWMGEFSRPLQLNEELLSVAAEGQRSVCSLGKRLIVGYPSPPDYS